MKIDINEIFKSGFNALNPGDSKLQFVLNELGPFDEKAKYDFSYDLYWDNICITFDKETDIIEKIDISFEDDTKYKGYYISPLHGNLTFQKKISIEKLLMFLNYNAINYSINNSEVDHEYLFIFINEKIRITYYLPWKQLIKITITERLE